MLDYLRDLIQGRIAKKANGMSTVEQGDEVERANDHFTAFTSWLGIFGSDGAVVAFYEFMQALYRGEPREILTRLYGDLLMEARKDMGYPDTIVQREHLLVFRP
jgi:hypothetical protein